MKARLLVIMTFVSMLVVSLFVSTSSAHASGSYTTYPTQGWHFCNGLAKHESKTVLSYVPYQRCFLSDADNRDDISSRGAFALGVMYSATGLRNSQLIPITDDASPCDNNYDRVVFYHMPQGWNDTVASYNHANIRGCSAFIYYDDSQLSRASYYETVYAHSGDLDAFGLKDKISSWSTFY